MLVLEKKCRVCRAVKTNKQLLKRIYESNYFLPHSKDSLRQIAADYKDAFTYESILNHTKKHQFIDSQDYTEKMLEHTDKKYEQRAVQKAVKAQTAIQSIIDKGMERLENEEITVDTNQLIRASQVKLTSEAKTKDQELQAMEMIAFFASGAYKGAKTYDLDETNKDIINAEPS